MKIKEIYALYYSATGNTKKTVKTIADTLAEKLSVPVHEIDFTLPDMRSAKQIFHPQALAVIGAPVYAGRIPNKILPYYQTQLTGNGALALPVVTYGNRAFDDALMELNNELKAHGFHTIAGAAVPAEHAFSRQLASGRPDPDDCETLSAFAADIALKILSVGQLPDTPLSVPGNHPVSNYYRPLGLDGSPAVFLKAKPKTWLQQCNDCKICAENCPMGSISFEHPELVTGICIKCQSCIRKCPAGAKYFDDPAFLSHVKMLEKNYRTRREMEFFCIFTKKKAEVSI